VPELPGLWARERMVEAHHHLARAFGWRGPNARTVRTMGLNKHGPPGRSGNNARVEVPCAQYTAEFCIARKRPFMCLCLLRILFLGCACNHSFLCFLCVVRMMLGSRSKRCLCTSQRRMVAQNIKRLKEIQCYRGKRHIMVRGA
jgi:hypothetical protein